MRRMLVLATAWLPLSIAGCGCAETVEPLTELTSQRLTLPSEPARDGWVSAGGLAVTQSTLEGTPGTGDVGPGAGGPGSARRQFLSFDLSALPSQLRAGATVESALLTLYQARVDGTPYATHGTVVVDHVAYDTLDAADFALPSLGDALGTLSSDPALALRMLDVTAAVKADLASGRTRTQLRLRWSALDLDGDATTDQAVFADADDALGTGLPPRLLITYSVP
jgi:hypothetical protein